MSNDIPRPWHPHFERKGIPVSYRGLAAKTGVSHEAARRVIRGWSVKESTVRQVADALGVDIEVVHELRGDAPDRATPWEPPTGSALLSHEEREALSRLISLITARRAEEREGSGQQPAATIPAVGATADESHQVVMIDPDRTQVEALREQLRAELEAAATWPRSTPQDRVQRIRTVLDEYNADIDALLLRRSASKRSDSRRKPS